jgi:hypothetical protein
MHEITRELKNINLATEWNKISTSNYC